MIKKEISSQLQKTAYKLWPELKDELSADFFSAGVEYTKDDKFGDVSSTIAMQLAKALKRDPLELAEQLIVNLSQNYQSKFAKIETALPGFINFTFSKSWLSQQVAFIIEADRQYGKSEYGAGEKVQVEFISANPTGPIHVGNVNWDRRHLSNRICLKNFLVWTSHGIWLSWYISIMVSDVQQLA